ncbi:MAG: methyltransferase domain-containing protein [Deltaproteobacteria bacterium]|nr:MAG: methyltransferase domain-containing protein [Deltaproteobacteria bacterium]
MDKNYMGRGLREFIKESALDLIFSSEEKYTFNRLLKELVIRTNAEPIMVRKLLKELVDEGDLFYTYQYGCSFLERSINKIFSVSERVLLAPAGVSVASGEKKICVKLERGASFGTGQHPTTRLSLQAIDWFLDQKDFFDTVSKGIALDIGTGSGVLAIAAVKFGLHQAIGLDIESISRKEAIENIAINGLSERIQILDKDINEITGRFSLIMANLRLPTLKHLAAIIRKLALPGGGLVLSGVKEDEIYGLRMIYEESGFQSLRQWIENKWACLVFIKNGIEGD